MEEPNDLIMTARPTIGQISSNFSRLFKIMRNSAGGSQPDINQYWHQTGPS